MNSLKQDIWDWYRQNKKTLQQNTSLIFLCCNNDGGYIDLKYPSGFKYRLRPIDFPNRNLIPVFEKGEIVDYIHGKDAEPGPSMQRMLKSKEASFESIAPGVEA